MERDTNQPPASGLREALTPWFDHAAAWLVLFCVGLGAFTAIRAFAGAGQEDGPVALLSIAAATLASISVAWRASRLRELDARRRSAWRWLAAALLAQLVAMVVVPATRAQLLPVTHEIAALLQFAFFPCAAMAATELLLSTRRRSFGPTFWLEAALVALCVATVLWLALPRDLAPDALPARGSWTVGLDAMIGMLAAVLLLRRSDWKGWPGLVAFALALSALVGARMLEAHAAAMGAASPAATAILVAAIAAFAIAAHLDYLRSVRRAPPMDAAERGSPVAPLTPYAALTFAGSALLALHEGSFAEPAGLIAWVVCVASGLLFARQAIATALSVAAQTGLAARSAEARFNALIRNTADVIAIVTTDGTISYVTPTAERIFGFLAQDMIGQRLDELVAFDDRAHLREFLAQGLASPGSSGVMEARVPRGDERQRVVEIHGTNMESEPAIG